MAAKCPPTCWTRRVVRNRPRGFPPSPRSVAVTMVATRRFSAKARRSERVDSSFDRETRGPSLMGRPAILPAKRIKPVSPIHHTFALLGVHHRREFARAECARDHPSGGPGHHAARGSREAALHVLRRVRDRSRGVQQIAQPLADCSQKFTALVRYRSQTRGETFHGHHGRLRKPRDS